MTDRSIFRLEAVSTTWQEHLLLHRRMTKDERTVLDKVLELHNGPEAPIYHYMLVTKEIANPPPAL
jgi:hypothetical protein